MIFVIFTDFISDVFIHNIYLSAFFQQIKQFCTGDLQFTSAQIIEEMVRLAKEINEADRRGEDLGLYFREYEIILPRKSTIHL